MSDNDHHAPGFLALLGKTAGSAAGAFRNRAELLLVEWQEEKARLTNIFIWATVLVAFLITGLLMLSATVLLLVPPDWRPYVAGMFALLFLFAAFLIWRIVKKLLVVEPFSATRQELQKDRIWLESLK
jgi:uncharacterized membrane protein YqjE